MGRIMRHGGVYETRGDSHSVGGDVTMKHYLRLSVEDLREPMQCVEDAFEKVRRGVNDEVLI